MVPAAVGGLTLCGHGPSGRVHERFDAPALQVALCIPDREVSTEAARGLLDVHVSDHLQQRGL